MVTYAVDEDRIMAHLGMLLNHSEPGAQVHHLHVLSAPAGAVGPLGQPDDSRLQSRVFAIAPFGTAEEPVDVDGFVAQVVLSAALQVRDEGHVVLFAAISQEVWSVPVVDDLARELAGAGMLQTHPGAAELTVVYGVCVDGRRWAGRRWLTGERAGQSEGVLTLVGRPQRGEGFKVGPLMRRMVGMAG